MSWKGNRAGGGSVIKSIQRGEVTFTGSETNDRIDLMISSVDIDSTIVLIHTLEAGSAILFQSTCDAVLTTDTSLRLQRSSSASVSLTIMYEVIEFENLKSFQKGSVSNIYPGTDTININEVNQDKCMIFQNSYYYGTTSVSSHISKGIVIEFISNTQLFLNVASNRHSLQWFVVEFS